MGLDSFVAELFDRGQVRVAQITAATNQELARTQQLLVEYERDFRRDLPGDPPEFSLRAAMWGASMLHRACQFLVFRDHDAAVVAQEMSVACPEAANPAAHYSVDIVFRFLPDLIKLARIASRQDPLVDGLVEWARRWPLSSIGTPEIGPVKIDVFANQSCLLALYVDRVIARRDFARLDDPRVRDRVRQALGLYANLAPEVAAALENFEIPRVAL